MVFGGMIQHMLKNDHELAAVLAQLIASVLANHHMEKKSWEFVTNVSPLFSEFLSIIHQQETDYIALMLMADAGYDPSAAVSVFKRMEEIEGLLQKAIPQLQLPMTQRARVS